MSRDYRCLLKAFAKAYQMPVEDLAQVIGHDGLEVLYDSWPAPFCFRGYHHQELIDAGIKLGFAVIAIERSPELLLLDHTTYSIYTTEKGEERFLAYLKNSTGVLYTLAPKRLWYHAFFVSAGVITDVDNEESITYEELQEHYTPIAFFKVVQYDNFKTGTTGKTNCCSEAGRCQCKG